MSMRFGQYHTVTPRVASDLGRRVMVTGKHLVVWINQSQDNLGSEQR